MMCHRPPGTLKRKFQVAFLANERSLLVQNYDGITLVTPNKTHVMETRLDIVIKSPGLSLRSRSVHRDQLAGETGETSNHTESSRSSRRSLFVSWVKLC